MTWIRRIEVRGSKGDRWTVALSDTGQWGCSCPKWKFAKKDHATGLKPDCHHIDGVQASFAIKAPPRRAPPPKPQRDRFTGLDLGAVSVATSLEVGERFRHLDLDMTVTE